MKAAYDVHRRPVTFRTGDRVLLSTRNINLKRPGGSASTPKLMPRFIGPFTVTEVVGKGAYKLDLPDTPRRLHNVFNVCLLKQFHDDRRYQPPGPVPTLEDGDFYNVEAIIDTRVIKRGRKLIRQYLT
eukprot:260267-Chlamydomonas_euryale.AAC.1